MRVDHHDAVRHGKHAAGKLEEVRHRQVIQNPEAEDDVVAAVPALAQVPHVILDEVDVFETQCPLGESGSGEIGIASLDADDLCALRGQSHRDHSLQTREIQNPQASDIASGRVLDDPQ